MLRRLIAAGLAVAVYVLAGQATAGILAPAEHNRLLASLDRQPMIFFVARGPADSCGPGCNEWIAALGRFEENTAQRFRAFVDKLNGRNLPIFFHSAGGYAKAAAEVGLILRERRIGAGVG